MSGSDRKRKSMILVGIAMDLLPEGAVGHCASEHQWQVAWVDDNGRSNTLLIDSEYDAPSWRIGYNTHSVVINGVMRAPRRDAGKEWTVTYNEVPTMLLAWLGPKKGVSEASLTERVSFYGAL